VRAAPAQLIREANALREAGRLAEAEAAYARILNRWPELPDCWFNLGVVQRRSGRPEEALASYREALARGARCPEEIHLNRAVIYAELRQEQTAEAELRAALQSNPAYVPALLNLANLHEDCGRREPARVLYERILALDPSCALALARLANLAPRGAQDEALLARLRTAIGHPQASAAERAELGFALGRALDSRGEYGAAFAVYREANEHSRRSAPAGTPGYDRVAQERLTTQLISTALPTPPKPPRAPTGPQALFICGMFRSGSTLAEQLIAAHSGVAAGGELGILPSMIGNYLQPFPGSLASVSQARLASLAAHYREQIAALFPGCTYVTDKRPDNFMLIGLIKTLLPQARIVHTTRDPLDNCLSVYFLHLDQRMSYALDLMDIGHYYRQYRGVMAHWKGLFGADIIDFDYDEFVRAPAATGARLFAALGWQWDPRALEFPHTDRVVKTASLWQVREPLYRHASGRARHYEHELAQLREYLADLLPAAGVGARDL
jgi:tetratricopeptide (TPR) repeat protein